MILEYGEVEKHNTSESCYVILFGEIFDLTEFMKYHHKGGYAPLSCGGKDATGIFLSTHPLSVKKILKTKEFRRKYYIGKVSQYKPLFNYYDKFYIECKRAVEKYFDEHRDVLPRNRPQRYMEVFLISIVWIIAAMSMNKHRDPLRASIFGMMNIMVGFRIMHDLQHGALTNSRKIKTMFDILSSVGTVMSIPGWSKSHNYEHHTSPMLDDDPDCKINMARYHKNKTHKWYNTFQSIYTIPGYGLSSIMFELKELMQWTTLNKYPVGYRDGLMLSKLVRICILKKIGCYDNMKNILSFYIPASLYYTLAICPSHMHIDNLDKEKNASYAKHQVSHSFNYNSTSRIVNYLTAGLNAQIEHHLFPSIDCRHLPLLRSIIKPICDKHGVAYNDQGYVQCMKGHLKYVRELGRIRDKSGVVK